MKVWPEKELIIFLFVVWNIMSFRANTGVYFCFGAQNKRYIFDGQFLKSGALFGDAI